MEMGPGSQKAVVFLFLGVFFGFGFVVFSCVVSCVLMDFRLPS